MPCSPPIAFWSIVGQASLQTAGAIAPSTIARSKDVRTCVAAALAAADDLTRADSPTEAPSGDRSGRFLAPVSLRVVRRQWGVGEIEDEGNGEDELGGLAVQE